MRGWKGIGFSGSGFTIKALNRVVSIKPAENAVEGSYEGEMRAEELFNPCIKVSVLKNGMSFDLKTYLSFSVIVPHNSSV